ncbi:hypothetical protein QTP70_003643, partial [Hemibagrus guttatus]
MVMPSGAVEVNSFRVLVKNECLKETAIPVGAVIGCMYHTEAVTTIPPMETVSSEFDTNMINFGDSPISEQWKNRLCKKLAQKSHVFSMQEWDVGLARGVEHKIRLSDARPFRQRSRRLAPADIEDLSAVGHRWLAALSTYEFDIQYRPGRHNIDADLLSRNMADMGEAEEWNLKRAQEEDDAIGPAIQALTLGHWPDGKNTNPELLRLKRETGKLFKRDGLLYRLSKRSSGDEVCQLVLPSEFRDVVMQATHDDLGHLGQERTLDLLRSRFFWPKMSEDVEEYIKNCGECISYKTPPQRAAPLHQIVSHGPMDLVCMDFLSMETDSRGFSNVLVVTDHFTRYAQAFPTKSQKAHIVAKILMEGYFVHYGLPARIHTDQGRDFESRLIRELLHLMGIRKSRTTPYHPQGDPQPERFNRTLLLMLGTLDHEKKRTWSHQVSYLVHAYNSTKCDATGYSPYYLMFGREARLPVDLCFGTSPDGIEATGHSQYVAKLKEDLKQAYKLASEAADKRHQRNKKLYDQRVKFRVLELGDRVFLRNLGLRGKHKLESRWKHEPYIVVGKLPNLPVFKVKREDGGAGTKTIHRDHLLPIGQLVRVPLSETGNDPPVRPRTRTVTRKRRDVRLETSELPESSDSSSELEYWVTNRATQREFEPRVTSVPRPRFDMEGDADPYLTPGGDSVGDDYPERYLDSKSDENRDKDCADSVTPEETTELESESEPETRQTRMSDDHKGSVVTRSEPRPKRSVKPTVRLTYDKLGTSNDQPLTIVHK